MNRKLHHTLSAFVATAAFMVLGLVAAVPGVSPVSAGPSVAAQAGAHVDTVATTKPVASRAGKSARRQRHRIVMPYVSFASRS